MQLTQATRTKGLRTLDPPLSPPLPTEEIFQRKCLALFFYWSLYYRLVFKKAFLHVLLFHYYNSKFSTSSISQISFPVISFSLSVFRLAAVVIMAPSHILFFLKRNGCLVFVGFGHLCFRWSCYLFCSIRSSCSRGMCILAVFPLSFSILFCSSSKTLTIGSIEMCMKCMYFLLMKQQFSLSLTLAIRMLDQRPAFILLYHKHISDCA